MALRSTKFDVKKALANNISFTYAHLIKFERPKKVDRVFGDSYAQEKDYVYITDAGRDIFYNDGTTTNPSLYVANKVTKVGGTNETVKPKASNMTISLDAGTLNARTGAITITTGTTSAGSDGTLTSTTHDFVEVGFREGDRVLLTKDSATTALVKINTFTNDGKGFKYTAVTNVGAAHNGTVAHADIVLASEELHAVTNVDKTAADYSHYINREIFIYKVFIAVDPLSDTLANGSVAIDHADNFYDPYGSYSASYPTGSIIGGVGSSGNNGGGILVFKGIISNATLTDGPKSSTLTWTAASHWADFNRIQGRRTEDTAHRAIDADGVPDRAAALKRNYADDLGFAHGNTAVNLTAVYNRTEIDYEIKESKNFIGAVDDVELIEIPYDVPTEQDLRFNMNAKYIPVVYGVQKIDSIPIFGDTRNHNQDEVHLVHVLSEGRIGAIYDFHIKGVSSICLDEKDASVRADSNDQAEADGIADFVCRGQQTKGQVLAGYNAATGSTTFTAGNVGEDSSTETTSNSGTAPQVASFNETVFKFNETASGFSGMLDRTTFSFSKPMETHLTLHTGGPFQKANDTMVEISNTPAVTEGGVPKRFKIQNDYYDNKDKPYWSTNHRLLDTAYLHGQYTIAEGQTELPEFKTVIKGKEIECHNYDGSFQKDTRFNGEANSNDHTNFVLGTIVEVFDHAGNNLASGKKYEIIDKWFFFLGGTPEYRFRLRQTTSPFTAFDPGTDRAFYMKVDGQNPRFYMVTAGHKVVNNVTITFPLEENVTAGAVAQVTLNNPVDGAIVQALNDNEAIVSLESSANSTFIEGNFSDFDYDSATRVISNLGNSSTGKNFGSNITSAIVSNGVRLPSGSTTTDQYLNFEIEFTRTLDDGSTYTQVRTIVKYIGSTHKIVLVDAPWDSDTIPMVNKPAGATDRVTIFVGNRDKRVSTNPAMQVLDYLKAKTYGKGLKDSDIDLPSFITAAQACDSRSDVYLITATTGITAKTGTFRYPAAGSPLQFKGTISEIVEHSVGGTTYSQIKLTDVVGKFGTKWTPTTELTANQLIWNPSTGQAGVAVAGYKATWAEARSGGNGSTTSFNIENVDNASDTITISTDGTLFKAGNNNPFVKSFNTNFNTFSASGYSLYDADDIKYWKYVGWDSRDQRNATRHQLNQVINTSEPLFANVNKMLAQFNGILRYSLGKYQLTIEGAGSSTPDALGLENISQGDIIGDIKVTDKGTKKTFNTASLTFPDPQNLFANREITFFDSNFLKEDKGIPKQLSHQSHGITNYFNARFNVVQKLKQSRFGLTINFKIGPRGHLLLPGELIQVTYPKFGWSNKVYRISTINYSVNCEASITATEHQDNLYVVDRTQESINTILQPGGVPIKNLPDPVLLDSTLSSAPGQVLLKWQNSASYSPETHQIEIWRSEGTNKLYEEFTMTAANSTSATATTTSVVASNSATASITLSASNANIKVGQSVTSSGGTVGSGKTVDSINGTSLVLSAAPTGTVAQNETLTFTNPTTKIILDSDAPNLSVGQLVRFSGSRTDIRILQIEADTPTTDDTRITLDKAVSVPGGSKIRVFFADLVHTTTGHETEWQDNVVRSTAIARYYWARYRVKRDAINTGGVGIVRNFSPFHPASPTGGIQVTAQPAGAARSVQLVLSASNAAGGVLTFPVTGNPTPAGIVCTALVSNNATAGNFTFSFKKNGDSSFSNSLSLDAGETNEATLSTSGLTTSDLPIEVKVVFTETINNITFTVEDTEKILPNVVQSAGTNGLNVAQVKCFNRSFSSNITGSTTANQIPSTDRTYTFATGGFSNTSLGNGWVTDPAQLSNQTNFATTNDLFFCIATVSGTGATATIASSAWSAPAIESKYTPGADGSSVVIKGTLANEAALSSLGSTPSLGDGYIIGGNLYVCTSTTAPIDVNDFTNVGQIKGDDGADSTVPGPTGPEGQSTIILTAYKRSSAANLNTDSPGSTTYDFNTNTVTTSFSTGWSLEQQAASADDQKLYSCSVIISKNVTATSGAGGQGSILAADWSTPVIIQLSKDQLKGANGTAGSDGFTINTRIDSFTFSAANDGTVTNTSDYANTISVKKGGTTFTFDSSAPYAADTYRLGNITTGSGYGVANTTVAAVGNQAQISINSSSKGAFFGAQVSLLNTFLDFTIIDNSDDAIIRTIRVGLTKSISGVVGDDGARGPGIFAFDVAAHGSLTSTHATQFAATNFTNDTTAGVIAGLVIAAAGPDGDNTSRIHKRDRITITDAANNVAATRTYDGNALANGSSANANNFSTLVAEVIPGSAIVEGTLSANTINGGTISGTAVTVSNSLILGQSSSGSGVSKFHSVGKDSATSSTQGFFIGVDNTDGSTTFALGGGGASSTSLTKDGLVVRDASNNVRVALGDLSVLIT